MRLNIILLISLISLLSISVVAAEPIHDLHVDDKHIRNVGMDKMYLIHTQEFGDIRVAENTYNKIWINDTITCNTSFIGTLDLIKINGKDIVDL